jgi:REP element-mobilizing transposase RayT
MMQGITFRLADALPQTVLNRWIHELASQPQTVRQAALAQRLSDYLDADHGSCVLRDPAMARVTEGALVHYDRERYRLLAWCVMPNHVHVLIETITGFPLAEVVQAWKSYLAHKLNRMLGRTGELWEREYHDRYIRNAEHYEAAVRYIETNPVKAGLARFAHEWPYSSARWRIMRT